MSYKRRIDESLKVKIRNTIIPQFHYFLYRRNYKKLIGNELLSMHKAASHFCKMNLNLIYTRVDKGIFTVTWDKTLH